MEATKAIWLVKKLEHGCEPDVHYCPSEEVARFTAQKRFGYINEPNTWSEHRPNVFVERAMVTEEQYSNLLDKFGPTQSPDRL